MACTIIDFGGGMGVGEGMGDLRGGEKERPSIADQL